MSTLLGRRTLVWALVIIVVLIAALPPAHSQDTVLQKIESDNALIAREGTWLAQPASAASGGSYLYNAPAAVQQPAALSLEFTGPSVEILYVAGPTLGTLAIEVNGVVLRTVITTAPEVAYGQSAKIDYLTDEAHSLRVYAQAGGVVGVDAIVAHLRPPAPMANVEESGANNGSRAPCDRISTTHRVNYSTSGAEGTGGEVLEVKASYYGNYVVYVSTMTNLVPGDTNGIADVFLRYHSGSSCDTVRLSVATDGTEANGPSATPYISPFGSYVYFSSTASNLVAGDTNGVADIFVWPQGSGSLTRIPTGYDGSQANGASSHPWAGGDGEYVVFQSDASNLVPNDTNGVTDIFLLQRSTGQITRVSVAADGTQADGSSYQPSVSSSPSGRYVAFTSDASNLVADDTNGVSDIYMVDRQLGTVRRMSVTTDGQQANGPSRNASMAYLEGIIVWESDASNMIPGQTIAATQIYGAWPTALPRLSSNTPDGLPGNGRSYMASLSGGASYGSFISEATDLVANDTNNAADVFVRNWVGVITRVSIPNIGQEPNGDSPVAFMTSDSYGSGECMVVYLSDATNLVGDDTNNSRDVFAIDVPPSIQRHTTLTVNAPITRRVDLTWTQHAPTPTEFEIQRSPDGQTNWTVLTTTPVGQTSYSDTSVALSTTYYYRLRPLTLNPLYTEYSNVVQAILPALFQHTALVARVAGVGQVDLTWTQYAPTPTEFEVQRSPDGVNWTSVVTIPVGQASYSDTTGACGTSYIYRLRPVTPEPDHMEYSNTQSVTTLVCPNDTLALINPTTQQVSLINTLAVNPPPTAYTTYTINARASGQWVMGDWDGDGVETPGVYEASGAFMFTNDLSPTAIWSGVWIGLLGRPPVAGRFDASLNHDCLGVVDSAEFPPYGTGYAVYFTCNLTSGPTPPFAMQWLSVPFYTDSNPHGAVQIAAGDFNGDGVDTFGFRRDLSFLYTTQAPTILIAGPFLDRSLSASLLPPSDYGVLVIGDWNNDTAGEVGLLSQTGDFAYQYGSTAVYAQHTGQPIGTPIQAASWR